MQAWNEVVLENIPAGDRLVTIKSSYQLRCPRCGSPLHGKTLEGLCPKCARHRVLELPIEMAGGADASLVDNQGAPTAGLPASHRLLGAGTRIGHYQLLEKIGEGGFGDVYRAEQTEPVKRQVAVKVIKPGMASEQVVARFEAERQALALMEHPSIAKVFDGGATDSGRPYFVMELVRGIPITDYCDQHQLSTQERLKLFIQVCQAVQHAHQKGIIHRDLKPSNILVAEGGGGRKAEGRSEDQSPLTSAAPDDQQHSTLHHPPFLKVIDFGIAKATGGTDLTDQTVFTAFQQFLGSPTYMSPEQAEMGGLDLDTRSDIYSLGVLLYELLTGQTPFDGKTLLRRGIEELILTLRDVEPPRPSTRLRTLAADNLRTQAGRRQTEPARLMHLVRGDLDWIVMKCLEKNRTRRYETANALAMDVQRHLDQEPVLAVAPSRIYRLKKLVRRNRVAFSAIAAVTMALVLGLVASLWQAARAAKSERQQRVLRQEAQARAYAADMRLAQQALSLHNLGRTRVILDRYRPVNQSELQPAATARQRGANPKSEIDLRGWEWRYLWQQSRSEALDTLCQTSNWVYNLSVSADGNWLAVGEMQDGGLSVWDLKTKKKVATLPGGLDRVQVAFSPREPLLAFSAITSPSENVFKSSVFLWDGSTREIVAELPLHGGCEGMAFSGDGSKLATFAGGSESQVSLWHVADGARLTAYSTATIQDSPGHKVAFDRDLTVAASGLTEGRIRIFDALTGTERRTVTVTDSIVNAVALSADGKLLAGASGFDDGVLYLWEVETGHQIARVAAHRGRIDTLHFWPDGKRLVSGSSDQTILVWNLASLPDLPVLRRLQGHRRTVWDVALLPDNSTLVSGGEDRSVLLWDTTSVQRDHSHIALPGAYVGWHWAADSRSVVTVDEKGRVVRWHGVDFQEKTTLQETSSNLSTGVFSSDFKRLATDSDQGELQIWDIAQNKLLFEFHGGLWPRTFLSDGNTLIVQDPRDGRIKEWSLADGRELKSWGNQGQLLGNVLSADDRWLIRLGQPDQLRLTDRMTDEEIPLNPRIRGAYGAAFSADGTQVAIASYFGLARVWETSTGREVATFTGFEQGVHSAAFSPDGKRLATTSQGTEAVKLWDLESFQELLTLPAREEIFFSTQFSPDGNVLGAMHYKQGLHLWRAPSWAEIDAAEPKD